MADSIDSIAGTSTGYVAIAMLGTPNESNWPLFTAKDIGQSVAPNWFRAIFSNPLHDDL